MTTKSMRAELLTRQEQVAFGGRQKLTIAEHWAEEILTAVSSITGVTFPSPKYQKDPVGFFRDIIGVEPWWKQVEVLEAVRDHPRVAVRAGHKVSKSHSIAGVAMWFYCSWDDARVVLTSTTARQVDEILWRELRMMRARSGRCVACKAEIKGLVKTGMATMVAEARVPRPCPHSALIDGDLGDLAKTGFKSEDFREIVGFTAKQAEAVAGISGANLLYLADESSGIDDIIFEAIEGNRAGGARIVLFSNPTKNEGEFFEAFNSKSQEELGPTGYKCITISSEDSPNVAAGEELIPGLAGRDWIEARKIEWGEESAQYIIRVKGLHATKEQGRIFSVHAIVQAEQRWPDASEQGLLFIGLDPAGATGTGDETAFAPRRGLKSLGLKVFRGLSAAAHVVQLLGLIRELKLPRETPVVVLDREGPIGMEIYAELLGYLHEHAQVPPFVLVTVRASDRAQRQPRLYDRMRDELTANLEQWFRDGGAIPSDPKLTAEMRLMEYKQAANGRLKVTDKLVIKKILKRSPDRYDALALSVWEPLSLQENIPSAAQPLTEVEEISGRPTLDPYAAMK